MGLCVCVCVCACACVCVCVFVFVCSCRACSCQRDEPEEVGVADEESEHGMPLSVAWLEQDLKELKELKVSTPAAVPPPSAVVKDGPNSTASAVKERVAAPSSPSLVPLPDSASLAVLPLSGSAEEQRDPELYPRCE